MKNQFVLFFSLLLRSCRQRAGSYWNAVLMPEHSSLLPQEEPPPASASLHSKYRKQTHGPFPPDTQVTVRRPGSKINKRNPNHLGIKLRMPNRILPTNPTRMHACITHFDVDLLLSEERKAVDPLTNQ
jgi:hypothetical protein